MDTTQTVEGLYRSLAHFGVVDYVSFVAVLTASVVIGLYYGFFSRKGDVEDYLVGGRKMGILPISMSLMASLVSGISIQGFPMEVYVYGMQIFYVTFGMFVCGLFLDWIILPVICELKITSVNEYLELRFNKWMRLLSSGSYVVNQILINALVLYGPVLGFEQVTSISLRITAPIICFICIFYTCIGGLKAVVWTDLLQMAFIFVALVWILIKGALNVGGFSIVLQKALAGGRIEWPSLSTDLSKTHTLLTSLVGGAAFFLSYNVTQGFMQRFMALPSVRHARISLWIYLCAVALFNCVLLFVGFAIYAAYYDCDPLTTKLAKEKDKVLPLFVMHTLGEYPGMTGLFISSLFSAGLSTLSTGLNSIAAVVLEDFVKTFHSGVLSERKSQIIIKGAVIVSGIISLLSVYVLQNVTSILQVAFSLHGLTRGATLGMFLAGMMLPWTNSKGLAVGVVVGIAMTVWVFSGAQAAIATGALTYPELPMSVEGCNYNFTLANATSNLKSTHEYVLPIYQMSFMLYTLFGLLVTLAVAVVVSFLTGYTDPGSTDPRLLCPFIRKLMDYNGRGGKQRFNSSYEAIALQMIDSKDEQTRHVRNSS